MDYAKPNGYNFVMYRKELIYPLFERAEKQDFLEYIYCLLRVSSVEFYSTEDPYLRFKKDYSSLKKSDDFKNNVHFWNFFGNVIEVGVGKKYNPFLVTDSEGDAFLQIKDLLPQEIKELFEKEDIEEIKKTIRTIFFKHSLELRRIAKHPKFYKMPGFEVFELISTDNVLTGFKVHFSNGSNAEYSRTEKSSTGLNVSFDGGEVGFFVGCLDDLKHEWMVGTKRLYEIGLVGRYNSIGEWKPIVYPGKFDPLAKEAREKTTDDRIQGVLFYMYATGYRVFEFAIKTPIYLPNKLTALESGAYLYRLEADPLSNEYIYDGWIAFSDYSLEGIRKCIETAERDMQGLAFAFDSEVKWVQKYPMIVHGSSSPCPNNRNDMKYLRSLLASAHKYSDITIDTAMSWYSLGQSSSNPLNSFLSFHIAIESLIMKIVDGELALSNITVDGSSKTKEEKKTENKEKFDNYYESYYSVDVDKLITASYFEIYLSIKARLKSGMEAVLGADHEILDDYFKGNDSIWNLRGKLVHDGYCKISYEDYLKIWKKVSLVEEIAKVVTTRVLLDLKPGDKSIKWSRMHKSSMDARNPQTTLAVTKLSILPHDADWKIRPEWIE